MSMADITLAGQRMMQAADAYHGKIAEINQKVSEKTAEVDVFLLHTREKLAAPARLRYDSSIVYSKSTFGVGVDPANATRTNWKKLPDLLATSYCYGSNEYHFAAITLLRRSGYAPGNNEIPNAYALDKCVSVIDFILAPAGVTNAQLNAAIAADNIVPGTSWGWDSASSSHIIPIVNIAGSHPARYLYARFRNIPVNFDARVPPGTAPQEITTYGGDTTFIVDCIDVREK